MTDDTTSSEGTGSDGDRDVRGRDIDRRALLKTTGILVGGMAVAGCSGGGNTTTEGGGGGNGGTATETATEAQTTTAASATDTGTSMETANESSGGMETANESGGGTGTGNESGTGAGTSSENGTSTQSGGGGSGGTTHIAIISSPAGFGDKAFNTLAVQGLQAAAEEYDIQIQKVEETSPSNYESVQSDLASSSNPDYDLIVLVANQHKPGLETNAPKYPDQNWMLINDYVDQPNVAGYAWANHQMSYLAGVMAGTMTTEKFSHKDSKTAPDNAHVGFVGGVDGSFIRAYEKSFIAGAKWVNSDIDTSVGYIGNYQDVQTASNIAGSQYDDGADIIYHAAAAAGKGVFAAAQDAKRFAIGVDADQSVTLPEYKDVIMGSAVKYINKGTHNVAVAVAKDNFDSIAGQHVIGLKKDAVALVPGQAMKDDLPDVVSKNLDDAKQAIIDGDITVPCTASGCK